MALPPTDRLRFSSFGQSRGQAQPDLLVRMARAIVISVIVSSRDDRHLGDARHDGFRPGGRGHFSSRGVHRMRGHSACIRESLSGSDSHFRSSSLHGSHFETQLLAFRFALRCQPVRQL